MGRKERGDGQDVTEGARSPDESRRGEKEGTTSLSTGKHRNFNIKVTESRGYLSLCYGMELHHPITSKLRDLRGQT